MKKQNTHTEAQVSAPSAETAPVGHGPEEGVTTRVVTMTPQWAAELLQKNDKNRPVSKTYLRQYAQDMQRDKWELNGETIKIASDGRVLDGQKRLMACVDTGLSFQTVLVSGLDPIAFGTIDTGQKRTAAHTLNVLGEKNAQKLAAVLRFIGRYNNAKNRMANLSFTNVEIEELLTNHPLAIKSVEYVLSFKAKAKIAPFAVLAGCHYLFAAAGGEEKADKFIEQVIAGTALEADDMVYLFRERMIRIAASKGEERLTDVYIAALLIKAWNYRWDGLKYRYLRWKATGTDSEPFPVVKGAAVQD